MMAWILRKNQLFQILQWIVLITGLLLIIILGFKVYSLFFKDRAVSGLIDQTTYQAVFLENDQIYFGKLKNVESQYPILEDVYYVRLEGENATSGRLVELGETEPHGPQNSMTLNRDHILFWENLKADSQVVQTIHNLKLNQ